MFETLWNKAPPAEQRTKEIEEIKEIEKTEVLYGPEEAINEGIDIEKTEIVYDPLKAKALYLELVDSANTYSSYHYNAKEPELTYQI